MHNGKLYNLDSSPADIRDMKSRYTDWSEQQTRREVTKHTCILKILVVKNETNVHLGELGINGKLNVFVRVTI